MTTISPTRVSMYDFLYQDTQPIVSLLADVTQLSLPQTQIALGASLQAIISALLAYQQQYQSQAISKKLFERSAVKELRQYNAMNFATIKTALYHRSDVANDIFGSSSKVMTASQYMADQIDASATQVQILLSGLCVIVLRELAILVDYSQLDYDELDKWFKLQPQFLSAARFASRQYITIKANTETAKQQDSEQALSPQPNTVADNQVEDANLTEEAPVDNNTTKTSKIVLPPFDSYWYELTQFTPANNAVPADMQQKNPNYLQAIGRAPDNDSDGQHNDLLVFASMSAITLPDQRWLLQLAKIADICLSRKRLRITSEPDKTPTRPFVNLKLIGDNKENLSTNTNTKTNKAVINSVKNDPLPLWKNPVILIIIIVIGALSALAALKYQNQKHNGAIPAKEAVLEHDNAIKLEQENKAMIKDNESKLAVE